LPRYSYVMPRTTCLQIWLAPTPERWLHGALMLAANWRLNVRVRLIHLAALKPRLNAEWNEIAKTAQCFFSLGRLRYSDTCMT
jgi:hypothetical protein